MNNDPPTPEFVPFDKADLHRAAQVVLNSGEGFKLSGDRSLEVWKIDGQDALCVRIFRPTDDGKVSELVFGLTMEAAQALAVLLLMHFPEPESEPE